MRLGRSNVLLVTMVALVAGMLAITLWITATPPAPPDVSHPDPGVRPSSTEAIEPGAERRTVRPEERISSTDDPAHEPVAGPTSDRIEGRVLQQDGRPAPSGTTVIARRRGRVRVDPDIVERVRIGDPTAASARSGADGRFVLEGLEAGAEYLLCAAGGGYVGKTSDLEVRTGTNDAVIQVVRLYGIALRFREAGGAALRSSAELAPPPARTFGRADPYLDPSLLDFVGADLAGFRDEPGEKLLLYTAQGDPPILRDLVLRFQPAGYALAEVHVDVPPVLPAIAEKTIELEPRAAGWGELAIEFLDGADPTDGAPVIQAFQVALAPFEPELAGAVVKVDLPRGAGTKHVRGIPYGRYQLSLRNAIRQTFLPAPDASPIVVEIGAEPVVLPVSLAGLGEVEVLFEGDGGELYAGPATISLPIGRFDPDLVKHLAFGGQVLFERGPYRLRALLPGSYTLFLGDPDATVADSTARHAFVELEPGSARTVRSILP